MTARALVLLALCSSAATAQSLEQRIDRAPDGEVRFSYAARQGVSGNGSNIITWDSKAGRCKSQHVGGPLSEADRDS